MRLARLGSLAVVATLFLACASKDRPPVSDISNTGEVEANKCAATEYASRQRILMLIVLDGSGSMASDHKWDSVVPALDSFFDDLKTQADSAFAVGLTIFSDKNDMQTGAYSKVDVPIGVVDAAQAGALRRRIDPTGPSSGTPTFDVLSGQYPALATLTRAAGKLVLVLMTDGVPNGGTSEQAQCTKAARDRLNDGILTFSVGIGNLTPYSPNSYDAKFMAQIALAGGTAKENCNPSELTDESKMCHFQVTPGDKTPELLSKDFVAAMNKIRTAISSCDYLLDRKKFPNLVPEKVKVAYVGSNGTKVDIPKDAVNGWTFDDPTLPYTVSLHGSFCEQARQDTTGKVTIVPGCDL